MATQPERIASLETSVKHIKGVAFLLIPLLVAWGAYITVNVVSIKQSLIDGGDAKLVAQLKTPASAQELQTSLTAVISQVQKASANGKKGNPRKVIALSDAVSQVVANEPNLPKGWEAAAQLITYRSGGFVRPQNEMLCGRVGNVSQAVITGGPASADMVGNVSFSNCTLDLDQPNLWTASGSSLHVLAQDGGIVSNWHLELHNVVVHYSGTPLSHVSQIIFDHCVFDFQFSHPPASSPGRALTRQLLATVNLDSLEVYLPTA